MQLAQLFTLTESAMKSDKSLFSLIDRDPALNIINTTSIYLPLGEAKLILRSIEAKTPWFL